MAYTQIDVEMQLPPPTGKVIDLPAGLDVGEDAGRGPFVSATISGEMPSNALSISGVEAEVTADPGTVTQPSTGKGFTLPKGETVRVESDECDPVKVTVYGSIGRQVDGVATVGDTPP